MKAVFLSCTLFFSILLCGQPIVKKDRTIAINTSEGTAMSVDISPNGKTLAFDLLGEIFIMPAVGGTAKQLTRGMAVNSKPAWSPDGSKIAFITDQPRKRDRITSDDLSKSKGRVCYLAVVDTLGNNISTISNQSITISLFDPFTEPFWSQDGRDILCNSLKFSLNGEVENIQSTIIPGILRSVSSNPQILYFQTFGSNGSRQTSELKKLDLKTGAFLSTNVNFVGSTDSICNIRYVMEDRMITYLEGSLLNPPGYGAHLGGKISNLIGFDVTTGNKKKLAHLNIESVGQMRHQRYSVSKDERFLFIGYGGKIHRIDLINGENKVIPFKVDAKIDMGRYNYNEVTLNNNNVEVKSIKLVTRRPDGKQIVFTALNQLYVQDLPYGSPRRLCPQLFQQLYPAYSHDGKWIAFVSYIDSLSAGDLWVVSSSGGMPHKYTENPGKYIKPTWLQDNKNILILKAKSNTEYQSSGGEYNLYKIDLTSRKTQSFASILLNGQTNLSISNDGRRIYFEHVKANGGFTPPRSKDGIFPIVMTSTIEGTDVKIVAEGKGDQAANKFFNLSVSPDEKYVLYEGNTADIYIAPLNLKSEEPSRIYDEHLLLPVIRLAHAGINPRWEEGGKIVSWSFGNQYYRASLSDILIEYKKKSTIINADLPYRWYSEISLKKLQKIPIDLTVEYKKALGVIALVNAKIVTMNGKSLMEKGVVVVKDGVILTVGQMGTTMIPKSAKIIDCSGKTIIPGLIDAHYHAGFVNGAYRTEKNKPISKIELSYGVTTLRDPSGSTNLFGISELINSGEMIGSRLFGVGDAIREEALISSQQEANRVVKNYKDLGAIAIKEYAQPSRLQQMWLQNAAVKAGINITHECPWYLLNYLAMSKDGTTGNEHAPNWGDIYDDVLKFLSVSKTYITPTLHAFNKTSTSVPWLQSLNYFQQRLIQHPEKKFDLFLPSKKVTVDSIDQPIDTAFFMDQFRVIGKLRKAGANIVASSHSNIPGIGVHFEMEAFTMGGMSNFEAIESATIVAAKALGIQKYLGSIEVGKFADLLILDKNPLDNITNTRSISYVMKDGILYDGNTLNTVWEGERKSGRE